MNRKGLSDVVTTVLIILLVIAAIVIIWSFIGPTLTKTGETINYQAECLNYEAKVTACVANSTAGNTQVTVQLVKQGEVPIAQILAVAYTSAGASGSQNITAPSLLTTNTTTVLGIDGTSASAAVYIKKTDGSSFACGESIKTACSTVA